LKNLVFVEEKMWVVGTDPNTACNWFTVHLSMDMPVE